MENNIKNISDGKDDIVQETFKKEIERGGDLMKSGFEEKEQADTNGVADIIEEFRFAALYKFADRIEDHHQHDTCKKIGDDVDIRFVFVVEDDGLADQRIPGE